MIIAAPERSIADEEALSVKLWSVWIPTDGLRKEDIPEVVAHDFGRVNDTARDSSLGSLDEGAIGRTSLGGIVVQNATCAKVSRERRDCVSASRSRRNASKCCCLLGNREERQ